MTFTKRQIRDFWARVRRAGVDECWEWDGCRDKDGYGVKGLRVNGKRKMIKAHRMAWELLISSVPSELFVLHKCDNPGCVNPGHLFLGTALDNSLDMRAKGRDRYIGRPPKAQLPTQVN